MTASPVDEFYYLFKERAEALSASVFRTRNATEVPAIVAGILEGIGARKVVGVHSPLASAAELEKALSDSGTKTSFDDILDDVAEADAGISEFDLAIADTGTLCQDAEALEKRLVSTLPPVHIALVRTAGLVRGLAEAFDALEATYGGAPPGFLAFVSGPSRTADIERVLTIGVHGPGQLFVIFVDEGGRSE